MVYETITKKVSVTCNRCDNGEFTPKGLRDCHRKGCVDGIITTKGGKCRMVCFTCSGKGKIPYVGKKKRKCLQCEGTGVFEKKVRVRIFQAKSRPTVTPQSKPLGDLSSAFAGVGL